MSRIVFLIAKLANVEPDVARRAMSTAWSQDDPLAPPPAEFSRGRAAMVYALSMFAGRKPVHFYAGMFGLVIFPIYLLVQLVGYLHGR
jgi:hypothetical protein